MTTPLRATAGDERRLLIACPICEGRRLPYAFSRNGYRIVRCADCRLLLENPQASDDELAAIYSESYFLGEDTPEGRAHVVRMKSATAGHYLAQLARYRGGHGGRLLEVGCGRGEFLGEAQELGYDVTGVEISEAAAKEARERLGGASVHCGPIECLEGPAGRFDVCVLSDVIEHVRDPVAFLRTVRRLLEPDGVVFIATPSLDSWSARLFREQWMEFKPEHLTYFDSDTIQSALYRAGFREAIVQRGWKVLSLAYVAHHFARFPVRLATPLVLGLAALTPRRMRERHFRIVASGIGVFARAALPAPRPRLSVIVPACREAATLEARVDSLLRKELAGLDLEVVVVEARSLDGTGERAFRYRNHPRVRVVQEEDRLLGGGGALRAGLRHATGDFVLVQDARLEYDLEDYDALLEPLVRGQAAVVVGARQGGRAWKMRDPAEPWLLRVAASGARRLFTALVNAVFGLGIRDPFTTLKVFRRDCLFGLPLEGGQLDFELLIQLARKGYRPVEIPVSYHPRPFPEREQGSPVRDALSRIRVLFRLRRISVDPMREVEGQRARPSAREPDR